MSIFGAGTIEKLEFTGKLNLGRIQIEVMSPPYSSLCRPDPKPRIGSVDIF